MTHFPKLFNLPVEIIIEQIPVANGDNVPMCESRNITLKSSIVLKDVLHVPKLTNSLLSIQSSEKTTKN